MAQFLMDFHDLEDMEKIAIPENLKNDDTYIEMIKAGQEIMLESIKNAAMSHKETGRMAQSLKATKPVIDKEGNAVGRIKFTGSEKRFRRKDGGNFDLTNWLKAFRIEYGTSKEKAKPFVRPAIISAEPRIRQAMQSKFEEKIKNGK